MRSGLVAVLLGLASCGDGEPAGREYAPPAGIVAHVEILREVNNGIAAVPGCGLLAGGVLYDVDGTIRPAATHTHDLVGAADLDGDGVLDLVTAGPDGALAWSRGAGCNWSPSEQFGGPLGGIARGVQVNGDVLRVGWSDGARVCRLFRRVDGRWREELAPEPLLAIRRTWFVRTWASRVLYGLDAAEGWTDPPLPAAVWAPADPMGAAVVHLDGAPMLFVGGLPAHSMLLAEDGTDHADVAGVRGPALTVTWQSAVTDLDGDGREDVIALALDGHNASDGRPAHPRVLLQLDGGRFATLPVMGGRLWATRIACIDEACVADGGADEAVMFRVSIGGRP